MKVEPIRDKEIIKECIKYFKERNKRNLVLFSIGIYTGLRIGDILKLKVKDVYKKNNIYIKQEKTKKIVDIPINSELKKIIKDYCKDKLLNSYLIESREKDKQGRRKPISKDQAYKIMNEMALHFNLDRIGTHTLRKTAGYHLYYSSNKDIVLVMRILGHSHESMTLKYIGVTTEETVKQMRKLSYFT
ncbi:MAG: tyrosine-type recombinase/integrase [Clostridium sp.]